MRATTLVLERLVWLAPTLLCLLAVVFALSRLLPVDPALLAAGEHATAAQVAEFRARLGLDDPLPAQFLRYLADVARGDLGTSLYTTRPIAEDLLARAPATLELTVAAVLLAAAIGGPLGVAAGLRPGSATDQVLRVLSVVAMALAPFWIAIQLQLLFSMQLRWAPLSGRIEGFPPPGTTGLLTVDALLAGDGARFASALGHLALPALTLALPAAAHVQRFMRNGVANAAASPSALHLAAMGMPRRVIVWKYILRRALSATVTLLGILFGMIMTGAVVVEAVFDWPGLGGYAVRSILHSDFNAVMGFTLAAGALFVVLSLLVDLAQAAIDPRDRT